ncbi:MAG: DUF4255 domain-containing protein [Deltaproteobacteria bacterium]|nr:DUF4255 domain-containing protein [Deltaproteobacteria bacterium]MCW5803089.1 DUF4255 domain-containing protein [Deltaproteobacteria bacterium]
MFADVNRTIETLLKAELPGDVATQIAISFATPDETFPPQGLALPAINFFLHEIHEHTELRTTEPELERRDDGRIARVAPPVRIDCHYLVTAVAQAQPGSEHDEHRILGAALTVLLRHRVYPAPILQGALAGKSPPVRAAIARKGASGIELWQALKGKPRACFHYTLTVPFDLGRPEVTGAPVGRLAINGVA